MKTPRMTRRQFFKLSTLGAAPIALSGLAALGVSLPALAAVDSPAAGARPATPQRPEGLALPQPTFNSIASNTTFGPLTDISMGWDGTLWGIDAEGAPHVYDSINSVWAQHGDGIDAAIVAGTSYTTLYIFRGPEVVTINTATLQVTALTTISALWPQLPDSFKLGVKGACPAPGANGALILFNGGRYVATDGSVPPGKLTDFTNWPQTANWKDGVIDAIMTNSSGILAYATLIRRGEAVDVDMQGRNVPLAPSPFHPSDYLPGNFDPSTLPASWAAGVDAGARTTINNNMVNLLFKGAAVAVVTTDTATTTQIKYLGNLAGDWPATWHPVLAHAPNGRDGNLWSALPGTHGSHIVQHDGDSWSVRTEQADHVGVGQDNTVMIASANRLWTFNGAGFDAVSQANDLIQVSLGNANAVNARDINGNVYSFNPTSGALTQNTDVGVVTHIATTNDGSLWHAKSGNPNMNRQIVGSGAAPQAIPVKQGVVSEVLKVAGTGFGAAHCLVQDSTNGSPGPTTVSAYRYDSPFLFKTAQRHEVISHRVERGLGLLYLVDSDQVIALDAHTGAEVARSAPPPSPQWYNQPVFDPILQLVYIGSGVNSDDDYDNTTPGQLFALDARTLAVRWTFVTPSSIDAEPGLNGKDLCVSDRSGKVYMFDTAQALANPSAVTPRWTASAVQDGSTQTHRVSTPAFVKDQLYVAAWDANAIDSEDNFHARVSWVSYKASDGTPMGSGTLRIIDAFMLSTHLMPPIYGQMNITPNAAQTLAPTLYYNCNDTVVGVSLGDAPVSRSFTLPAVAIYAQTISSGFAYDSDTNSLWFGSLYGSLYCLDVNLRPASYTPFTPVQDFSITAAPVIYKDTQGDTTILFGAYYEILPYSDPQEFLLRAFDPDTGVSAVLPIGVTRTTSLSNAVINGVLYVAGVDGGDPAGQYAQVWGIRVDALAQATRDFIIESQLMQDPDPNATGSGNIPADPNAPLPDNPIPPSKARYQTQLTIVDDDKTPVPHEPVKVWADAAGTVIAVNGAQYTIGPDDSAYASIQTGVDGAIVITSDANDANASPLRMWAAFMDPYERIMVYPDQEWHQRVSQSVNDPAADPNKAPDPSKPNLSTVHSYKLDPNNPGSTAPKQLFTDDEKNQQPVSAPQNVANAIGTMKGSLNLGGASPATLASALQSLHASNSASQYIAYTTLTGMHYLPTNARVQRTVMIGAPAGFQLSRPSGGAQTLTPMSHSDARDAIDALAASVPGANVKRVRLRVNRSDDAFGDFWNNLLQGLVQGIENLLVSVADDILVGFHYLLQGVLHVLIIVVEVIGDIVRTLVAIFVQLEKIIEDVIEALSVLFHFGEIMWTHRWLAGQMATYKETLKTTMTQTCQDAIDKFIEDGETAIAAWIDSVKKSLNPQQSIGTEHSMGSTTHTAMSAQLGSAGNSATGNSQAVQGSWGIQHMKNGLSNGAGGSSGTGAGAPSRIQPAQVADDPVTDFLNGFIQSLSTDPVLSQSLSDLKDDFSRLVSPSSAQQFFVTLVDTLLDTIKTMLVGAMAVGKALFDGLIGIIGFAVDAIWNALLTPWDIPVISWLYKLLFQEDLNLLNLATLVVAIPVTIIYRVAAGEYPQDSDTTYRLQRSRLGVDPARPDSGILPDWAQKAMGTTVAILNLVYGIVNAFLDFLYPYIRDGFAHGFDFIVKVGTYVSVGIGLFIQILTIPTFTNDADTISRQDWGVYGISVAIAVGSIVGTPAVNLDEEGSIILGEVLAFVSTLLIAVSVAAFVADKKTDVNTDLGFAANIIGTVPVIVNPLKYLEGTAGSFGGLIDAAVDTVAGCALCALGLAATWHQESSLPHRRLYYFPRMMLSAP